MVVRLPVVRPIVVIYALLRPDVVAVACRTVIIIDDGGRGWVRRRRRRR
jgi:hypothetical protein